MVEVTFCIDIDDRCVPEAELDDIDAWRARLRGFDVLEGAVVIRDGDGTEVRVEDELEPAIQNVCFLAIPDLAADEHVVVRYFSYYGYLRFDPEGDNVLISGDFVPELRVERRALLPALYDCGRRFIECYRRLTEGDSYYEANIEHLEQQAQIATQALS